jgi:HD-GYP domain-containing protein (c-di-GMP phosphodiesterase class II)
MLVPDRTLQVEILVSLGGRAVRWALAGDVLERSRIDKLLKHKVRKVLIRAEDEKAFEAYIEAAFDDTLGREDLSAAQKVGAAGAAADMAANAVIEKPTDAESYRKAQRYFAGLGNLVASLKGGLQELLGKPYSGLEGHDHMAHSERVAAISVALATRLELLKGEKDRVELVTAAYLHDIGLESAGIPRSAVHDPALGAAAKPSAWAEHPLAGARIFQGLDHVSSRVMALIAQHEEIPNGEGFPQKLTAKQMDPLAVCLSLANRFEDTWQRYEGQTSEALKEFFKAELGRFELPHLEALRELLKGVSTR